MIVLKFGGTSVGGADPIRRVGQIIRTRLDRNPVVIVSAVGGMTNRLFALRDEALEQGDWEASWTRMRDDHATILTELELDAGLVDELLDELHGLLRGISLIRECTPRTLDYLVSFGERISARIVSAHLRSEGVESGAHDAFDVGLLTDGRFGLARPLPEADELIRKALGGVSGVPIVTGYIGKNEDGSITTLGRGGSDYSASIFGAALDADEIQIWTDVDGVMTADPRIVDSAKLTGKLSFAEAGELAFYGAKVVHPATMMPAVRRNIPIRVLNTYKPEFQGTVIVNELAPDDRGVKSITSKDHVTVVSVVAPPMALQYGFVSRIADVFKKFEIVVDMIATSEISVALTTSSNVNLDDVVEELSGFSRVTVRHGMAQVSVVGEEIRDRVGFAAEVFATLSERDINVELISFGATRINLSFVVARERVKECVVALHERLFGS